MLSEKKGAVTSVCDLAPDLSTRYSVLLAARFGYSRGMRTLLSNKTSVVVAGVHLPLFLFSSLAQDDMKNTPPAEHQLAVTKMQVKANIDVEGAMSD